LNTDQARLAGEPSANLDSELNKMDQKLLGTDENFSVGQVRNSELFKIDQSMVRDPRLADNLLYKKLIARLEAFYIQQEKFRKVGLTEA
jgi:hypothetical protein